jgi:hypothetical protein
LTDLDYLCKRGEFVGHTSLDGITTSSGYTGKRPAMIKIDAVAAAILFCIMLSACAAPVPGPDIARFTELKSGSSTLADAVILMGKPTAVSQRDDGSAVISWLDRTNGRVGEVVLLFDKHGKFVRSIVAVPIS